mgnify:CR=1 FL=1
MKLISWNVNGLRACLTHGFADSFAALDADIFSVQETKMQPGQADFAPEGYTEYTYSAEKKGYSGTACWCRQVPLAVTTGIGLEEHDHEGRVLTLEYPGFYLVNCYTPNSQDGGRLPRLPAGAGREKAGDPVRRPERSPHRNGHQERKDQPDERRLYRPGAGQDDRAAGGRVCRQLPGGAPG